MAASKRDMVCQRKRYYKEKLIEVLEDEGVPIERSALLTLASQRNDFSVAQRNSMDQALEAMLIRGTAELVCLGDKQHVQLLDKNVSVNMDEEKSQGKEGKLAGSRNHGMTAQAQQMITVTRNSLHRGHQRNMMIYRTRNSLHRGHQWNMMIHRTRNSLHRGHQWNMMIHRTRNSLHRAIKGNMIQQIYNSFELPKGLGFLKSLCYIQFLCFLSDRQGAHREIAATSLRGVLYSIPG
ncbi:uncharacterized protein LOC119588839 [Penaeus monodon]|uniref:uncharacterized protein LOC119588839 n=1 Tax=Penaeus monodon TaxID=6687 RepID=UPI0018A7BD95|nr:uncharacterized protein LOC119588839 [Penaeus monodon]